MARRDTFRWQVDQAVRRPAGFPQTSDQRNMQLPGPPNRDANPGGSEDGQSLVELALTIPILFMLVFCFMELCLAFYTHNMISEVARQGTRYAMFRGASCPTIANPTCEVTATQVKAYVMGLGWPDIGGGTMTVADPVYPDGNEAVGSHVQVKVIYVFNITMPFVPKNSICMSSTSKATIVQ